jgi:hypothetical protein
VLRSGLGLSPRLGEQAIDFLGNSRGTVGIIDAHNVPAESPARRCISWRIRSSTYYSEASSSSDRRFGLSADKCRARQNPIAGRVVRSPGLQKRGFVAGDHSQPWKARLLLSLASIKTTNAAEIQRMFDRY